MTVLKGSSVEDLTKRIEALEMGAKYDADQAEVHKVQAEMLTKLRDIRSALAKGGTTDSKEVAQLQAENTTLKERNAKLEYRVKHVVDEMERMYAKLKEVNAA